MTKRMSNTEEYKEILEETNEETVIESKPDIKKRRRREVKEDTEFTKHSLLTLSKKAGVSSISQEAIDKINEILNDKIKELAEKLSIFCNSKNGRTITNKLVFQFLESENILYTRHALKE
jgi:histone H3/H4